MREASTFRAARRNKARIMRRAAKRRPETVGEHSDRRHREGTTVSEWAARLRRW